MVFHLLINILLESSAVVCVFVFCVRVGGRVRVCVCVCLFVCLLACLFVCSFVVSFLIFLTSVRTSGQYPLVPTNLF